MGCQCCLFGPPGMPLCGGCKRHLSPGLIGTLTATKSHKPSVAPSSFVPKIRPGWGLLQGLGATPRQQWQKTRGPPPPPSLWRLVCRGEPLTQARQLRGGPWSRPKSGRSPWDGSQRSCLCVTPSKPRPCRTPVSAGAPVPGQPEAEALRREAWSPCCRAWAKVREAPAVLREGPAPLQSGPPPCPGLWDAASRPGPDPQPSLRTGVWHYSRTVGVREHKGRPQQLVFLTVLSVCLRSAMCLKSPFSVFNMCLWQTYRHPGRL